MTKNAETATADFASDFAALREDVAKLTDTIGQIVKHQTDVNGGRIAHAVSEAGRKGADMAADAQAQVRAAGAKIEAGIEQHPLAAVLIAFGVGMSLAIASRARN